MLKSLLLMKQTLKSGILEKRKSLSKREIDEKSRVIKEKLFSLNEFKDAKNIMFYVSFNNEVDTINIIKGLLDKNEKKVIVPFVEKGNPVLQLSEIKDFNDLEPKTFGILEPRENKIKNFDIGKLDLAIVPGIAFDKKGHRIGYGYGYYDRLLEKLNKNIIKIGLCYEFQLIDKIPKQKHDIPMDIIITEKRIVKVQ